MSARPPQPLYSRDPAWCIAYLKGRIKGYQKGNLGLRAVGGAIELALRCNVSLADIVSTTLAAGLHFDPRSHAVRDA